MLLDLLPLEQQSAAGAVIGTSGGGHGGAKPFVAAHTVPRPRPPLPKPVPLERHTGSARGLTHTTGHAKSGVPHLTGHANSVTVSASTTHGHPVIAGEAGGETIHTGSARGFAPARRHEDELIILGVI